MTSGLNVLVSGGTQAGRTTLLNCLTAAIPPQERVVTCEEVFELKIPLPDVVALQCRQPNLEGTGEIKLRRPVKQTLRMRPSRIVVGEVRQEATITLSRREHGSRAREMVGHVSSLYRNADAARDGMFADQEVGQPLFTAWRPSAT